MPTVINGTTRIDKVQNGIITINNISATGTPSVSTFLSGAGAWQSLDIKYPKGTI